MKNFNRVLGIALKMRLMIVGVFVSSLLIGLMWGANISTIYPVVEIIFRGRSVSDWVDEQIVKSQQATAELESRIAKLQRARPPVDDIKRTDQLRDIDVLEKQLELERKVTSRAQRFSPFVRRYLPSDAFQTLVVAVLFLIIVTAIKAVALMVNSYLVEGIRHATTLKLRCRCYDRVLGMDLAGFAQESSGVLLSRLTNDVAMAAYGVNLLIGKALREPIKMLTCLAGAAFISWRLLILTLVICPCAVLLASLLSRFIRIANRQMMSEMAHLYEWLSESLRSMTVVKAFTMENAERGRLMQSSQQLYRKAMRIAILNSLVSPSNELIATGSIAIGVLAGGYLVINQQTALFGVNLLNRPMTAGSLLAFYAFLAGASEPVRKLSGLYSSLQSSFAAADRLADLFDHEVLVRDPTHPHPFPDGPCDLELDDVTFHYDDGPPVLKSVNLRIPFGETVAIVGPNGSGKSTLINLLMRFYDPQDGAVRIGGIDLRDLRQHDLRTQIGLVTQHSSLFDDTVMNNIRIGSPDASDQDVMEAAHLVGADRFVVDELDAGFYTVVGEQGGRISGGQRQRIEIVRAMLRDPKILIMDEATSEVDSRSEQLIHAALLRFTRGRTAIMITHKLSTLFLADTIVVMDQGRIVATGRHDDLIRECSVYQQFCRIEVKQQSA
jgi:subfamily B ATP-binding cassette protein MsbA